MEEGGEGIKAQVKEMSDWEYLSIVAARRAAAPSGTKEPYVDRSEYPVDADIEYEVHWDKRRRRFVPRVPKWSQDEYASRTDTPANDGKQDCPNSASQATAASSSSSGTKALMRPPVENLSAATDPCDTEEPDPNSASEATAADTEAEARSLLKAALARQYEHYPDEYGYFLDERCKDRRLEISQGPIKRPGLPPELKSRVVYPKRPLKDNAGAEVK